MPRLFTLWLGGLIITSLVVLILIVWVDRPVALAVHEAFGERHLSTEAASSPAPTAQLASALVFAAFGLAALLGRRFLKIEWAIILCDISVLAADAMKNELKHAFGRTWPDSWDPEIMSLVRDNVYGFQFFHLGRSYESFPSGHATVVAAAMSVLWILFPRLRAAYAICIGATDLGLVLLNLHFVSDVVAGTFVGVSAGLFTVTLWACGTKSSGLTFEGTGV